MEDFNPLTNEVKEFFFRMDKGISFQILGPRTLVFLDHNDWFYHVEYRDFSHVLKCY